MQGEAVASGSLHADNIAPSLFGGLVLTVGIDHPRVKQIPVPDGDPRGRSCIRTCRCRPSRRAPSSSRTVNMSDFVWQTANLAGFISGCYTNDLDLIKASLEDVVIEPQRQVLIPGFAEVRARGAATRARWAARSPAPGRRCSRCAWSATRAPCAMRWCRRSPRTASRRDHWIVAGAVRWRACGEQRMKFASTRGRQPRRRLQPGAAAGPGAGWRAVCAGSSGRDLSQADLPADDRCRAVGAAVDRRLRRGRCAGRMRCRPSAPRPSISRRR